MSPYFEGSGNATQFDMRINFYDEIKLLKLAANDAYIRKDAEACLRILERIYGNVRRRLKEEQRETLQKNFQDIRLKVYTGDVQVIAGKKQVIFTKRTEALNDLDILYNNLVFAMDEAGMILPAKKSYTPFEAIKEKFKRPDVSDDF